MKTKLLSLLPCAALVLSCASTAFAFGVTGKDGAFTYEILDDGTARITEYDKSVKGELVIPAKLGGAKVTAIAGYVFQYDDNITSVVIPEGVTYIGDHAFYNCKNLKNITLPSTLLNAGRLPFEATPWYAPVQNDDVIYLGSVLVKAQGNEKTFNVKNGTKGIAEYAFSGNTAVEKVVLPATVVLIGNSAFAECSALKECSIPENLASLGNSAFSRTAITEIEIPAAVESVPDALCFGCASLKKVTFPSSLKEVRSGAFGGCTALETVCYPGTEDEYSAVMIFAGNDALKALKPQIPGIQEKTLYKSASENSLYVPAGTTVADYYAAINENFYYVDDGSGKHPTLEDKIATRMAIRLEGRDYLAVVLGDADGNGEINVSDARTALRTAIGLEEENEILTLASDTDFDGKVTVTDARSILRAAIALDDPADWFAAA